MIGALVSVGLLGVSGLAAIGFALQAWLSRARVPAGLETSLAAFACALLLLLIALGREFGWWHFSGAALDQLAVAWIGVTAAVTALAWWLLR